VTPPLSTALVGFGLAGAAIHGPLLAATAGIAVTDVVTGDPGRAAAATAAHPGVAIHASYGELLGADRPLDLVVLASPTFAHAEQAEAALARGLAVVVDKPLAVTAADARRLVALAGGVGGGRLTVFQNRRWDSEHLTVRDVLASGARGAVFRYEARYERWRPEPKDRWRERLTSAEGGGLLLDLQSHLVDGAVDLFGPVVSVYAEIASLSTVADDVVHLALTHGSGVRSHLGATSLAGAPGPHLRVLGRGGAYVVGGVDGEASVTGSSWQDADDGSRGWLVRGEDRHPVPAHHRGWMAFYGSVVRWLRDSGPLPVDPRDAVHVLDVLDAARESAAAGETRRVARG
jgi:predicted dehydrogenase